MSSKTLIRGGCVLTLEPKVGNFARADVLIEEGHIAEISANIRTRDAELIGAADTIVMPGFIDTHRHVWKSLFRNIGGGEAVGVSDLEASRLQPEDVYTATLIGLLGAVEAGITTAVDWSDVSLDTSYRDAALQAHADAGLRTVFVQPISDSEGSAVQTLDGSGAHSDGLLTTAAGIDELSHANLDRLDREFGLARRLGLRIHAHAGLDQTNAGLISELGVRGLLGRDVTLVHCSHASDADLDAVAAHGVSVSVAPSSEMTGDLGPPPMQRLIDRGIRPGLGVDNEGIAPGDLFAQMRAVISLQHATYFDLKLAGKAGLPRLLSTRDVIRYATIDGARAVGLGGVTGSLQPGKQADLIVLRTDRPNILPVNDPIGAVAWGMDTSNIDWVFVAGRTLIRNGILETDVTRARMLATAALQRVTTASGPLVGAKAEGHPWS